MNAMRRAMARVLVVMACHGWGIVSEKLEPMIWYRIAGAGILYMFTIFISGINQVGVCALHNGSAGMLVTVETFLDTLFYFWIYLTIKMMTFHLIIAKEEVKFLRFRWFVRVLLTLFFASFFLSMYQTDWMVHGRLYFEWENTWFIMTGCWDICYLVALSAMMWIWRPSSRNHVQMNYKQMNLDGQADPCDQTHAESWQEEKRHSKLSDCSSEFSDIDSDLDVCDETADEDYLSNSVAPSMSPTPNRSRIPSTRPQSPTTKRTPMVTVRLGTVPKKDNLAAPSATNLFPKPKKTYTLGNPMS